MSLQQQWQHKVCYYQASQLPESSVGVMSLHSIASKKYTTTHCRKHVSLFWLLIAKSVH
jgi:hypothetical protein